MLKYFMQAYQQGYRDGLRSVCSPSSIVAVYDDRGRDRGDPSNVRSRPAYQAGFREGVKDREEIRPSLFKPERTGFKVTYSE